MIHPEIREAIDRAEACGRLMWIIDRRRGTDDVIIGIAYADGAPFDGDDDVHRCQDHLRFAEMIRDARRVGDYATADRYKALASAGDDRVIIEADGTVIAIQCAYDDFNKAIKGTIPGAIAEMKRRKAST
tara:strand:- start:552 stop:941 length:390 start_codon:yes stop_codon:yes gene_type:complete